MENWITVESFGADVPANWQEIADHLNGIIAERHIEDDHAAVNDLWEEYCNGDIPGAPEPAYPHCISIDNGMHYVTPEEALERVTLDTMAVYMDDETRERVHRELAPCSDLEFLTRYLEIAPDDLIIG